LIVHIVILGGNRAHINRMGIGYQASLNSKTMRWVKPVKAVKVLEEAK
jgi:hypothetical protein